MIRNVIRAAQVPLGREVAAADRWEAELTWNFSVLRVIGNALQTLGGRHGSQPRERR